VGKRASTRFGDGQTNSARLSTSSLTNLDLRRSGRQPWIKNPTRRRGFYEASVVSLSPPSASEPANAGPEDGFYQEEVHQTADGPKQKQKVLKKIPPEVCLYHFTDLNRRIRQLTAKLGHKKCQRSRDLHNNAHWPLGFGRRR